MVLRQQTAALSEKCQPRQELPVACLCPSQVAQLKSGEFKNPPSVHSGKDKGFSGKHLEVFFPLKVKLQLGSPTDRERKTGPCAGGVHSYLVMLYLKCMLPLACGRDVCV